MQHIQPEPATLHYAWRARSPRSRFRTAVSLHSHTLHSREALDFIPRIGKSNLVLRSILAGWDKRYRALWGKPIDYSRTWWTPPVCAKQAFDIERRQIETQLDLAALVSISDHDNMDAARLLPAGNCVWSVEWSVPFRGTVLHVGVHNIAGAEASAKLDAMNRFTVSPTEALLSDLLEWFGSDRGTLVVLNHPLWDEKGIGTAGHRAAVGAFLDRYGAFVHTLELNGLRPWRENSDVVELARSRGMNAISGGDRHGVEPNATLNLTNATTFAEFVSEVRSGKPSDILFMPQYQQGAMLRVLHNVFDIVGEHPEHSLGWTHVCDRVFHLCDDGSHKSLTHLLGGRRPSLVRALTSFARFARQQPVRSAMRFALRAEEVV